jgi:two-component system CheB/CheR fusion protein
MQAISEAEAFRPDVMLVDIGMPRVSGHEVARTIRAKPWGAAPLLIAVTGWTQESDRQRSRDAGFDLHLSKPVDATVLQELMRNTAGT